EIVERITRQVAQHHPGYATRAQQLHRDALDVAVADAELDVDVAIGRDPIPRDVQKHRSTSLIPDWRRSSAAHIGSLGTRTSRPFTRATIPLGASTEKRSGRPSAFISAAMVVSSSVENPSGPSGWLCAISTS